MKYFGGSSCKTNERLVFLCVFFCVFVCIFCVFVFFCVFCVFSWGIYSLVSEARDIKKCDSFCIITAGAHKLATRTVYKKTDPFWGESYEMYKCQHGSTYFFSVGLTPYFILFFCSNLLGEEPSISVTVWDKKAREVLGRVEVPGK